MPRWTADDVPDLTGRVAVVTGANSGLGLETALAIAARGAKVVLACRNPAKAAAAAERVGKAASVPPAVVELDLGSLPSVAGAAEAITRDYPHLDLLINNAGLMAVDESRTADGFETQIGVNHLGHFALTAQLMAGLLDTPGSRVVNVSSFGHRLGRIDIDDLMFDHRRYTRGGAYFQSKLANLLFTAELDRRLRQAGAGTAALAAHPGFSRTDLGNEGSSFINRMVPVAGFTAQPASIGALSTVRAATDPAARSGEFYGPQYMFFGYPHRETPSHRARSAADARSLWDRSLELTKVDFPI